MLMLLQRQQQYISEGEDNIIQYCHSYSSIGQANQWKAYFHPTFTCIWMTLLFMI